MAMTSVVKDELSRVQVIKPCCRKAEVSTLLRFAGGLHLSEGRVVIEAELDTGAAARRLRASISEVFGHPAEFLVLSPSGLRKGNRYLVRVSKGQAGESLARQAGLIDSYGRPVRGLPRQVVSGSACDCEAAWRGAFLAHGSLTEPGRSMALEITCPGSEAALALVGAARRLKVHAKARDVRGVDRVVIRDGEAIAAMLTRLGAHQAVLAWEERRMRREVRATANRLANFDDANLRRSARAAVAAGARVERALEILGPDAPRHLTMAGQLRMAHRQASLEERPARGPAADQGRHRGPHPPPAGHGRPPSQRAGHPEHRSLPHRRHAPLKPLTPHLLPPRAPKPRRNNDRGHFRGYLPVSARDHETEGWSRHRYAIAAAVRARKARVVMPARRPNSLARKPIAGGPSRNPL